MSKCSVTTENIIVIPEERIGLYNVSPFSKNIEDLIAEGHTNITIDFNNVTSIDCAGIGVLFKVQKKLLERQGKVKAINVNNQHVQKLFALSKLNKIITVI